MSNTNKAISPLEKKKLLRERVAAIKDKLPKNYRGIIIRQYPQYDTQQGAFLISNVVKLSSTDEELTEILEQIVAKQEGE